MTTANDIAAKFCAEMAQCDGLAGVAIFKDTLGATDYRDEGEIPYPHAVVTGDMEAGGAGNDMELSIKILVGVKLPFTDDTKPIKNEDGYWEIKGPDALSKLTSAITTLAETAKCGAVYTGYESELDYGGYYPLQYTILTLNYKQIFSY